SRRRHTRWPRDWSSDVCSSDLYDFWSKASHLRDVRRRAESLLERIGLGRKAGRLAAHLSHGEKRHLEIGIALATDPALLLLDERSEERRVGKEGRCRGAGRGAR